MGETNLTGRWTGVYFYPPDPIANPFDDMAPTPFTAQLLDVAGHVTGQTVEPDLLSGPGAPDIHATLEGDRSGSTLTFTKFPDGWQTHTIDYIGRISADGATISGDWIIHGDWSGAFRMQRRDVSDTLSVERTATV